MQQIYDVTEHKKGYRISRRISFSFCFIFFKIVIKPILAADQSSYVAQ